MRVFESSLTTVKEDSARRCLSEVIAESECRKRVQVPKAVVLLAPGWVSRSFGRALKSAELVDYYSCRSEAREAARTQTSVQPTRYLPTRCTRFMQSVSRSAPSDASCIPLTMLRATQTIREVVWKGCCCCDDFFVGREGERYLSQLVSQLRTRHTSRTRPHHSRQVGDTRATNPG
jgi:hypothetical protein